MIWKDVVGYEGLYQVSDTGEVRSISRKDYRNRTSPGRILKPWTNKDGYLFVNLYYEVGKYKSRPIHSLVVEAFIGPRPEGFDVCHGENGKLDNSVPNLSYGSHRQNCSFDLNRDHTFSSKHPGVSWDKRTQKWKAQARWQGKHHNLGLFEIEEEAAKAYTDFLDKHLIPC
jgi:hypothetical protein